MSKAISLKLENEIFESAEKMIKKLNTTRNKYINDAVSSYTKLKEKERIHSMMQSASLKVRNNSLEILQEFEGTSLNID